MTQEEKEVLLADLCARSPYKVKVQIDFGEHCIKYGIDRYVDDTVICVWPETFEVGVNDEDQACDIEDVKPYLRSTDEISDEESNEMEYLLNRHNIEGFLDFVYSRHIDWRNLIEKGLALKAPKNMYKQFKI